MFYEGYAAKVSDVEHAAEFVADTAPLLAIISDAACFQDRLAMSAKHFHTLWTDMTPQGHRFFRSAWFSSTAIDQTPPKGRDVEYKHARGATDAVSGLATSPIPSSRNICTNGPKRG